MVRQESTYGCKLLAWVDRDLPKGPPRGRRAGRFADTISAGLRTKSGGWRSTLHFGISGVLLSEAVEYREKETKNNSPLEEKGAF